MTISKKQNIITTFAPTIADYVQDGLVCLYDGENNIGLGMHSSDSLAWKNLGSWGSTYDAVRRVGTFNPSSALFEKASSSYNTFRINNYLLRNLASAWTVEVVFAATQVYAQNYSGIFGNHGNGSSVYFGQYVDGYATFSIFQPARAEVKILPSKIIGRKMTYSMAGNSDVVHYMNGNAYSSFQSIDTRLNFSDNPFTGIGSAFIHPEYGEGPERCFDGQIFCVRVYNRMLSASEVQSNFVVDKSRFKII